MSIPGPLPAVRTLVAEAARRSRVCWLSYDSPTGSLRDRLVWHAWHDDAVLLVADEDQPLPGIADATAAVLTFRSKDNRARLVTTPVEVARVAPDDGSWDASAAALVAVRLNLEDPKATVDRWRSDAAVVRLTPLEEATAAGTRPLP